MKQFADLPIAKKLISITLATTVTALLLASLMQAATEGLAYRDHISHNLATMAEIIGTNSVAALIFEDEKLASQVLQSLEAEPTIIDGHIYHADGELMAGYYPGDSRSAMSRERSDDKMERIGRWIADGKPVRVFNGLKSLDIVQPIHFDEEKSRLRSPASDTATPGTDTGSIRMDGGDHRRAGNPGCIFPVVSSSDGYLAPHSRAGKPDGSGNQG